MFNQHVVDGPRQGEKKIRKPPLYLLKEKFWLLYYFKVHEKKSAKK